MKRLGLGRERLGGLETARTVLAVCRVQTSKQFQHPDVALEHVGLGAGQGWEPIVRAVVLLVVLASSCAAGGVGRLVQPGALL